MQDILSLNLIEWQQFIASIDEQKYRAKQIFEGLHNGKNINGINIPYHIREKIKENYICDVIEILEKLTSTDGTVKYLFKLSDGNLIEGVLMRYNHGSTLCVSTQVGCRMGCAFCASGIEGLVRNLTAGEMLGQVITVNRLLGSNANDRYISNIVLMGSGEPLDNYENVTKFLRLVNDQNGINISLRNISLSTCGLADKIRHLADENLAVNLSLSLHASNDKIRQQIMPIAKVYCIKDTLNALRYYFAKTGRRVIIEYILISEINDNLESADELSLLLKGLVCHVNVINYNLVQGKPFKTCSRNKLFDFVKKLNENKISATARRTMGDDIAGACGQLRRQRIQNNKI